eukprot:3362140-Pleurochrysis_carterae.AAC.1
MAGAPCSSGLRGDLPTETCAPFCTATAATAHCKRCQCKACDFCHMREQNERLKEEQAHKTSSTKQGKGNARSSSQHDSIKVSHTESSDGDHKSSLKHSISKQSTSQQPAMSNELGSMQRFDYYCEQAGCDSWCSADFQHWHCNGKPAPSSHDVLNQYAHGSLTHAGLC